MIEALRPHTLLFARALIQEIADDLRDLGAMRLQREAAGVKEADLCLWDVAPERFGADAEFINGGLECRICGRPPLHRSEVWLRSAGDFPARRDR